MLLARELELLREVVPSLHRLAIMANIGNPGPVLEMGEAQAAARILGLEVTTVELLRAEDIAPGFDALKGRAEALYVCTDPLVVTNRARIHTLAMSARLPTIYNSREYVEAGGLMSYGPNFSDQWRRTAEIVDKILHGAKAGDIPVEQPTKFELIINLNTAKALGLDSTADAARPRRRGDRMKRREFITLLGGAAVTWPLAARAQQGERVRRIGVLIPQLRTILNYKPASAAFCRGCSNRAGAIGRNVRIDTRWAAANADDIRRHAAELVALAPDVILAHGASTVGPLLQATRTVPIVFPVAGDPVAAGLRRQPGAAGRQRHRVSSTFEYSMSGKWLELLKEIAPGVTRAAVLRDPTVITGASQFAAIQAVAPSLRVEVNPIDLRDAGEIEHAVTAFARSSNGGLIVTRARLAQLHRDLIITLAARHQLPAVYSTLLRRRRRPDLLRA